MVQLVEHCTISQKVVGSIPVCVIGFFIDIDIIFPSSIPWGIKVAGAKGRQTYHFHVLIVMKSGSLNLLELSGPVQALSFPEQTADFLFSKMCEPFLGPIQPYIKWILGEPFSGLKWPDPGADHKLQNSAQVKNAWSYTFTLPYALMACKGATLHLSLLMLCCLKTGMVMLVLKTAALGKMDLVRTLLR